MDKLAGRIDSIDEEFASRYGWGGRIARGDEGAALEELSGVRNELAAQVGLTAGGAAVGYYASSEEPAAALGAGAGLLGDQGPRFIEHVRAPQRSRRQRGSPAG